MNRKKKALGRIDDGSRISASALESLMEEGYVSAKGRITKKGRRLLEEDDYLDSLNNHRDSGGDDRITTAEEAINLGTSMGEEIARRPVRSLFIMAIGLFF
jgi:hypothetical protein